ncbi:peroxisome biogenesis protein 22-like [Musa troglodytarum]|uniref:Peroxisome biogenesis protein 22-like n=1 Tax=Musa troglodytarum TaxID=320322 RepID=A0A9E7JC51_9LILI|nr:peroxisome biogenesis protein 22-like [Musa troglodytarum]
MSDRVAENVGAVVRRFSRHLNRKITDVLALLFSHKSAGSLGAVAGFAIAVVFAWKFLRPSRGRRTSDRRKPRASPSTSREATGADPSRSEGFVPVSPSKVSDAIEAVASPVEMTCQLLGVILEEKTPEELQKHATLRLSVLEVLEEISKYCDLYLMETVLDDESEERVLSALENGGVFQKGSLIKDKVLFCSTEVGRTSFVRQLEADWHIDSNLEIISQLSRFIRFQLYISEMESGQIAPNVFTSTCLEQFFS